MILDKWQVHRQVRAIMGRPADGVDAQDFYGVLFPVWVWHCVKQIEAMRVMLALDIKTPQYDDATCVMRIVCCN